MQKNLVKLLSITLLQFVVMVDVSIADYNNLDIDYSFTPPVPFINNDNIFVIGAGSINGDLLDSHSLNIGQDKNGNSNPNNFVTNGNIGGTTDIHIYGNSSFKSNHNISGVSGTFTVDFGATAIFNKALSGSGAFLNHGTTNIGTGGLLSISNFINNGSLTISGTLNLPEPLVNSGDIYVVGNGSVLGDIIGGSSMNVGMDVNENIIPSNFSIHGDIKNLPVINVYSGSTFAIPHGLSFEFSDKILGLGTIVNNGIFSYGNTSEIGVGEFINNGVINISPSVTARADTPFSGFGTVNNHGVYYITNTFGDGIVNNKNGAKLYLQSESNIINSSILNDVGAHLSIVSDLVMPNKGLLNNGVVTVVGNRNIDINSYVSPGVNIFSITNDTVYDSITVNNTVNLVNGIVKINSSFLGDAGHTYDWNIISADSVIKNNETIIDLPLNSIFKTWESTVTGTDVIVRFTRDAFSSMPTSGIYSDISKALDIMEGIDSVDAWNLATVVSACACPKKHINNLKKLIPHANISNHNVSIQNSAFNKTEMRIALAQSQDNRAHGISCGDISPNTSMWLSGFGSIANQKNTSDVAGYRATAAGGLIGFDKYSVTNNLYGISLGFSNSNIDESVNNNNNNRILGYHVLFYGADNINESVFFEWLVSGILNNNKGNRIVDINGTDFSVASNYHNWQAGFRFNLGQSISFDTWKFSQIETVRYTAIQQPGYDETGSPAALHVSGQDLGSILTLGVGVRASSVVNNKWLASSRELRVIATYDVIRSDNITTANFIAGGPDFSLSSSAARAALQLGASYGFSISNNMQLDFSYDFELRNKYTDNSGEIKLRYLF